MTYLKRAPFLQAHQGEMGGQVALSRAQQEQIVKLLAANDAVLISHYYTSPAIQALTEATGGFIGDSLEMAKFGRDHSAQTLLISGVYFMGETAKILSPDKTILMPNLSATCSLDLGCPIDAFRAFCQEHPERTVVVYANTSAAVKAASDWVVTSSIAVPLIQHLEAEGKKILWAPDKHLGGYLQQVTEADMVLWSGSCVVHERFKANAIAQQKRLYPQAAVLVHPESPQSVIELADFVGSTSQLLRASQTMQNTRFIVATEPNIFYKMKQASPNKQFIQAPTGGRGGDCVACNYCPWMAMNAPSGIINALATPEQHAISLTNELIERARQPLQRMLNFAAQHVALPRTASL